MGASLIVESITKSFGKLRAVDRVSFQVDPGEIIGFIGPNGAGKTTTMRICATLDQPDRGDVRVGDLSVRSHAREVRTKLGYMPDSFGAYPATSVHEYLDFFARAHGLKGAMRRDRIDSVVDFTGLDPLLDKELTGLSKGMKQRTCLAKTLLHDPDILILDEPAAGLDPRARIEFRELLLALADLNKAVLVSSHILSELSEVCTGAVVIESGRLQAGGSISGLREGMVGNEEIRVRALIGLEPLLRFLAEQPGIETTRSVGDFAVFEFKGDDAARARLLSAMVAAGLDVVEFHATQVNLEDIFMSLTEGSVQ